MARLSINVNKFATLRNARGNNLPCLIEVVKDVISYGAKGITVHPRPDERHITRQDSLDISELLNSDAYKGHDIEYNIEGYPSPEFVDQVIRIKPEQFTLVPDGPDVITSNAGWKLPEQAKLLAPILKRLREANIRSSLFVDPKDVDTQFLNSLAQIKPDRIELYTELYSHNHGTEKQQSTIQLYKTAADQISELGIEINAGHDLSLQNLSDLLTHIPQCKEVSIGHALVCESLYMGLKDCVQSYLKIAKD